MLDQEEDRLWALRERELVGFQGYRSTRDSTDGAGMQQDLQESPALPARVGGGPGYGGWGYAVYLLSKSC